MAKVTLYGFMISPPARGSMMSCIALGVDYDLKNLDVTKMEHHSPEYLKLNPIHSIPTLVDGDFVLSDSHAISCYLANKYGKDDKWYPKDFCQRAIVEQMLHFDCSVLAPALKNFGVPILFGRKPDPNAAAKIAEAADFLDKLLGDKNFVALDHPTIADCHCASNALSIQVMLPSILSARVEAWLQRCKTALPGYEKINNPAIEQMLAAKAANSNL